MTKEQAIMKLKEEGFVPVECIKEYADGSIYFACTYGNKHRDVVVCDQGLFIAPT